MLKYLFFICVVLLGLGQFSAVIKSGTINLYLFDLAIFAFVLYGLITFFFKYRSLLIPKNVFLFFVFVAVAFMSLIKQFPRFNEQEMLSSSLYLFRFLLYILSAIILFNMLKKNIISIREVILSFLYSGIFLSFAGFIQLKVLPDFSILDPLLGWDPHKNRLASTFFDPNFVGGYLVLCITLVFHNLFLNKPEFSKKLSFFSLAVLLLALFLTFSRSSWAMLAVVVGIYGVAKKRYLLFIFFILAFSVYFLVPRIQTRISGVTDPADSAHLRLVSWRNALEIAKDNPLLGVGFNTYRFVQKEYGFFDFDNLGGNSGAGADSSFLLILATTGLIGFITFVFAYFMSVMYSRSVLAITLLMSLFVHSQFVNSIFFPQILFFWLLVLQTI